MIRAILEFLTRIGRDDLAAAFTQAVESRQPPPPEVSQEIYSLLLENGENELAAAFAGAFAGSPAQGQPTPTGQPAAPPGQ